MQIVIGMVMIQGIGTDIVEVARIERILKKWGDRFINKVFCSREIEYCQKKAHPAIHFAARFAAKESFLKSLGIGLGMGVGLKDMEVLNTETGAPVLHLSDKVKDILSKRSITAVHISMTHTDTYANAIVVLEK